MSAKLRSFFDVLLSPWRAWARARRLPARVQVIFLIAVVLGLGGVVTAWRVARAKPQDEGGGGTTESVADQVHRLRTVDKNYPAAEALAADFLANHVARDNERQMVYFEYGMTLFDAQQWPQASAAFEALVAEYADTALDPMAPDFFVDDAAYYGAVTEHYHGDKALGIARYEAFLQQFPQSDRVPKALLMLAGAHEQTGDLAGALPVFQQLAQQYPESQYAAEAQIHVGQILLGRKDYSGAAAAFEEIAQRWPDSKHVPTAVQAASRTRIHQELDNWDPQSGASDARTVDNAAAIESNLAAFVGAHADDPLCPGMLLDLLNYHIKRGWWNEQAAAQRKDNIVRIVGWMQQVAPNAAETSRATLELAKVVFARDSQQALALTQAARQKAVNEGATSLLNDADFTRAGFLADLREYDQARTVLQALLEREQDPQFEAHVKLCIGCTYVNQRQYAAALELFRGLATDPRYAGHVRAMGLLYQGTTLRRLSRRAEAQAALEEAVAQYPDEQPTGSARRLLALWASEGKLH